MIGIGDIESSNLLKFNAICNVEYFRKKTCILSRPINKTATLDDSN